MAHSPDLRVIDRPLPAVCVPVVAAVVVDGAAEGQGLVEEEAVAARLVGQGPVQALVEVVAGVGVGGDLNGSK